MKTIITKIKKVPLFINSWDFYFSLVLSFFFIFFIFRNDGFENSYKDINTNFQLYVPVLSIFISLFTLSMTFLITSTPDDFVEYLESKGDVFSRLRDYHFFGFFIYIYSIFSNVALQSALTFKNDISLIFIQITGYDLILLKVTYIFFYSTSIFFTIWAFFYTISLLGHLSKLLTVKTTYYKSKKKN